MDNIKTSTGTTFMRSIITIIFCLIITVTTVSSKEISYQGRLTDSSNQPIGDGIYNITFFLYNDSLAGNVVWAETAEVVTTSGMFNHNLGSIAPFGNKLFHLYENLYLELRLENEIISPRSKLTASPYALSAEHLNGYDSSGIAAIATDNDKHKLTIFDDEGKPLIVFRDTIGDSAVVLPPFAINAKELLNEPGIAGDINTDLVTLQTGEMRTLAELQFSPPSEGYVVLYGKCYLLLSGTTGPNQAVIQVDDDPGGGLEFPYYSIAGLSGYTNSGTNYFPVFVTRVYYVQKKIYTFRLEGKAMMEAPAVAQSWDHVLNAVFYPTVYEIFNVIADNPMGVPSAIPIEIDTSTPFRESGTYYKVDLQKLKMLEEAKAEKLEK